MVAMCERPALYNGIRHFLFVIPPMAVMAGFGFARDPRSRQRQGTMAMVVVSAVFVTALLLPLNEIDPAPIPTSTPT